MFEIQNMQTAFWSALLPVTVLYNVHKNEIFVIGEQKIITNFMTVQFTYSGKFHTLLALCPQIINSLAPGR